MEQGPAVRHSLQPGLFAAAVNGSGATIALGNTASLSSGAYGPTNFDTQHNLSTDLVYVQPRFKNGLLDRAIDGGRQAVLLQRTALLRHQQPGVH